MSVYTPHQDPPRCAVGSQRKLVWAITTRDLGYDEELILEQTETLPIGVGYDPPVVRCDVWAPGALAPVTSNGVRETAGVYSLVVPVTLAGAWLWRGYGTDAQGNPVAAMLRRAFIAE